MSRHLMFVDGVYRHVTYARLSQAMLYGKKVCMLDRGQMLWTWGVIQGLRLESGVSEGGEASHFLVSLATRQGVVEVYAHASPELVGA